MTVSWPGSPSTGVRPSAPPDGTVLIMSAADGWDLTVPEDAADLAEEFRRHGERPGQRLHIVRAPDAPSPDRAVPAAKPGRFAFIGSVQGGPAEVSSRVDEYLQQSFGRG